MTKNTPYRRYKQLEKCMDQLYSIKDVMADLGIYGKAEFEACTELTKALSRAMIIADPDRADAYAEDKMSSSKELLKKLGLDPEILTAPPVNTGQYL